jgi:acetate kinase
MHRSDAVLVLNAGSSSLKFTVFDARAAGQASRLCEGQIAASGAASHHTAHHTAHFTAHDGAGAALPTPALPDGGGQQAWLAVVLPWLEQNFPDINLLAAAHRVVHGGRRYSAPVVVDEAVLAGLRQLVPLAPLHQPVAIAAIEAMRRSHPALTQLACFDTAFHHGLPLVESSFALPRALTAAGLRRYGFHGLSYEYIAGALPGVAGADIAAGRVVVAHLGAGASLCAMEGGRSVATTMSLTPLDGLPMGSRCGGIDPGALLYLLQEKKMSADAVADMLYHDSGLLGVSGISADMQTLLDSDAPEAAEAVDLFVYRIGRELGSLAAALGGIDALVFTGGIGQHAAEIRRRVCKKAAWLGLALDPAANEAGGPRITRADSAVSAWVVATDEDAMIMEHSRRLLKL